MSDPDKQFSERLRLAFLICFHVTACCVSLAFLSHYTFQLSPPKFHIFFDAGRLHLAFAVVSAFALVSIPFTLARFSFGYFVGFYFYTMILGYLWLNCFTDLNYDHRLAGLSAAASAVALLLPALFITSPLSQGYAPIPRYVLSAQGFDRLLTFILLLAVATIAWGSVYNFRIVALGNIYDFRDKLASPKAVNYLIAMVSSTLLPFAFAGFVVRKAYWRAGFALLLLLLVYPITLSKFALFGPPWLVVMLLLSRIFEARIVVILSLLGPLLAGLLSITLFKTDAIFFYMINFRMIAIPSIAMDVYNDFFSKHELTFFCQISFLKPIMYCPYQNQLSVVMEGAYKLGNFNGSLFATEGIASVGPVFAPVAAFACGLVIALANRLSAGLPPPFVLVSGAILAQVMLNVSLTTILVTHGGALLFLLWYITPRTLFEQN